MTKPDVPESVRAALRALDVRDETVLVACSGGLDSIVLLDALTRVAPDLGLSIAVGHVDHGLRGEESEADRKHVEATAAAAGLPCWTRTIDIASARAGRSNRERPTKQEAARRLRYQALDEFAREAGATRMATAHHLDDQAETVLLRLFRGTTGEGLGGIPERSPDGRLIRPLLALRRADLEAHARQVGLRWREDVSNEDRRYARNRLRQDWLGGLADAFNPQLVEALGRLAEGQRREREWLEPIVQEAFARQFDVRTPERLECEAGGWSSLPDALARRLVARAFEHLGGGRSVDRVHVERALGFLRAGPGAPGQREIEFPGGIRLRREQGRLRFFRGPSPEP